MKKLEIKQSEDGLRRYRWHEDEMWVGGFSSYEFAHIAAMRNEH